MEQVLQFRAAVPKSVAPSPAAPAPRLTLLDEQI
jgi:hypothetical protein